MRKHKSAVPASGRERGFTMLELLVVMALMMILMAVLLPSYKGMLRRTKLVGVAKEAEVMLRKARHEAVKRNQPVHVTVVSPKQVALAYPAAPALRGATIDLPSGIDVTTTFGGNTAILLPNGSVDGTGYRYLEFSDPYRNRLRVRVGPPATARVELCKVDDLNPLLCHTADEKPWIFVRNNE